jgi:hypothetical protein
MIQPLDYRRIDPASPVAGWRRRYLRTAPLFGLGYIFVLACMIYVSLVHIDIDPRSPPTVYERMWAALAFPIFTFVGGDKRNLGVTILLVIINAELWGLAIVVTWHASSTIYCRRKSSYP